MTMLPSRIGRDRHLECLHVGIIVVVIQAIHSYPVGGYRAGGRECRDNEIPVVPIDMPFGTAMGMEPWPTASVGREIVQSRNSTNC